jgi:hypothetical protein
MGVAAAGTLAEAAAGTLAEAAAGTLAVAAAGHLRSRVNPTRLFTKE